MAPVFGAYFTSNEPGKSRIAALAIEPFSPIERRTGDPLVLPALRGDEKKFILRLIDFQKFYKIATIR